MLYTNSSKTSAQPVPSPGDLDSRTSGLTLVTANSIAKPATPPTSHPFLEIALISCRRCSSFFAEAAVLVLVFGILDLFMLKGHIAVSWIFGALAVSVGLLAASVAMDFSAQRWIKAHP